MLADVAVRRVEWTLLGLCGAATFALSFAAVQYMLWQESSVRELFGWLAPVAVGAGLAACLLAVGRDRRMLAPAVVFAAALVPLLGLWTRTRYRRNEENCSAPGPLPHGWDQELLDKASLIVVWPVATLAVLVGLVLLVRPSLRPVGARLALAGCTGFAAVLALMMRCIGT